MEYCAGIMIRPVSILLFVSGVSFLCSVLTFIANLFVGCTEDENFKLFRSVGSRLIRKPPENSYTKNERKSSVRNKTLRKVVFSSRTRFQIFQNL